LEELNRSVDGWTVLGRRSLDHHRRALFSLLNWIIASGILLE